jgi:DNA-directed RNA polymerase subunit RPC12/RpoP
VSCARPLEAGEATVTRECATCGKRFVRRLTATRALWCQACVAKRKAEQTKRMYANWYANGGHEWHSSYRKGETKPRVSESDYIVPGPERIAEIEGRCGVCQLTYWTLDRARREAALCDRCAR